MKVKNLIILGGYSKYNVSLVKNMTELYSKDYHVTSIEYDHWYNDEEMDFNHEINKIKEAVHGKNIDVVLAKSIGTYLSTKAIKQGVLDPKLVVFLGYPMKFMQEWNLSYLEDLLSVKDKYKIIFIQQENDPLCSANNLKDILDDTIPVITVPGEDHSYSDIIKIKKHVDKFINKNLG